MRHGGWCCIRDGYTSMSRNGDEQVSLAWLAARLRDFTDLNPGFDVAVDRLASWLARLDDEED